MFIIAIGIPRSNPAVLTVNVQFGLLIAREFPSPFDRLRLGGVDTGSPQSLRPPDAPLAAPRNDVLTSRLHDRLCFGRVAWVSSILQQVSEPNQFGSMDQQETSATKVPAALVPSGASAYIRGQRWSQPLSASSLAVFESIASLRGKIRAWRAAGDTIVLVPTMGALHAGHLALVAHARTLGRRVVASLFVNPTQFGPTEDFSRYPRDLDADLAALAEAGADAAYAPGVATMYPEGFSTRIEAGGPAEGLCGECRPGHFSGVATVVTKLVGQVQPDIALFGEKDFQQLRVLTQVARDLDLPVVIRGMPTVREPDGLALSSRNRYLSAAERAVAPRLHAVLAQIAEELAKGTEAGPLLAEGIAALEAAGFGPVQYLELRDADTLAPVGRVTRPARVLAAAYLGRTRLIDNVAVP